MNDTPQPPLAAEDDFSFWTVFVRGTKPQDAEQQHEQKAEEDMWTRQAYRLLQIGVPIATSSIIRTAGGAIGLAYAGHFLSSLEFAAIVTGSSLTNITAAGLSVGLTGAMDTLGSQAYGELSRLLKLKKMRKAELSVEDMERLDASILRAESIPGLVFRRAVLVTAASFGIIAFLYLALAEYVVPLVVADDDGFATKVVYFMRLSVLLPLVASMMLVTCVHRYCQVLQVPHIPTYASAIVLPVMPVLLFLSTVILSPAVCSGSTKGCLETYVVGFALDKFALLVISVLWMLRHPRLVGCLGFGKISLAETLQWTRNPSESTPKSDLDCRFVDEGLRGHLTVGLPSAVGYCADLWAFEALSLIAASLGTVQASLWGMFTAIMGIFFSLGVGVAAGSSILIGAAVGARHFREGFATLVSAIVIKYAGGFVIVAGFWIFGELFYKLFTSDTALVEQAVYILRPAACILMLFDLNGFVSQGICRGAGQQRFAAATVIATIWVISVPLAYLLANNTQSSSCRTIIAILCLGVYDVDSATVVQREVLAIVVGASVGMVLQGPIMDVYMVRYFGWRERRDRSLCDGTDADTPLEVIVSRTDDMSSTTPRANLEEELPASPSEFSS